MYPTSFVLGVAAPQVCGEFTHACAGSLTYIHTQRWLLCVQLQPPLVSLLSRLWLIALALPEGLFGCVGLVLHKAFGTQLRSVLSALVPSRLLFMSMRTVVWHRRRRLLLQHARGICALAPCWSTTAYSFIGSLLEPEAACWA
jgi:hypothetical protein